MAARDGRVGLTRAQVVVFAEDLGHRLAYSCTLYTRFWSMVPYRLGDDAHNKAIKFSA